MRGNLAVSKLTHDLVEMNSFRAPIALGWGGIKTPKQDVVMVAKCANNWCHTTRHHDGGKMFRLDINLGNKAGGKERMTEYIWLCARCAQEMHPKVEVAGDTVTV